METTVGLLGGFVLSYVFWWVLNHYLVPKVRFSAAIARRPLDHGPRTAAHLFAFKNEGRRAIVDIRLRARLRIHDPRRSGRNATRIFEIALPNNEVFELMPGRMRFMSLNLFESTSLDTPVVDERIASGVREATLTLDDVLAAYPAAEVYVQLIGIDVFSSATKVFRSPTWTGADLVEGRFAGNTLELDLSNTPAESPAGD